MFQRYSLCLLMGAVAVTPATAMAQDVGGSGASAKSTRDEENQGDIVVTANRRNQAIEKTAAAITVITGSDITSQAKNTVGDILQAVPGVELRQTNSGGGVYIRGIGSSNNPTYGDPSVGLYVDGIYQQQSSPVVSSMFDIDRVEVLRGPQGTIYGRNANGGAVNILTNDPVFAFKSRLALQVGNYGELRGDAVVNTPINNDVAIRMAIMSERHNGYLSNGDSDADAIAARAKLLYAPMAALKIVLTADYRHEGGQGGGTVKAPLSSRDDPWETSFVPGRNDVRVWSASAKASYTFDWATLSLLSAYQDYWKWQNKTDDGVESNSNISSEKMISNELRLQSPADSQTQWQIGAYQLRLDQRDNDLAPNFLAGLPTKSYPDMVTLFGRGITNSFAIYGQATIPIVEGVRFTAGGRYTHDKRTAVYLYHIQSQGFTGDPDTYRKGWNSFTYKGQLEADLSSNTMMYGGISTGYKAGGFDIAYPPNPYRPEKLTAYQAGLKGQFFDRALRVNVEAFHYDYKDYQFSYPGFSSLGVVAFLTTNAARARVNGVELEATAKVSRHDQINVSASYLHSKFVSFVFTDIGGTNDYSRTAMPNSPEWKGLIGYEHSWDLRSDARLSFRAESEFSDGYLVTAGGDSNSNQRSFRRSNAFLNYTASNDRWRLGLYVRNIENVAVVTAAGTLQQAILKLQAPRTFGFVFTLNNLAL